MNLDISLIAPDWPFCAPKPTPEWRAKFAAFMLPALVEKFGPTTLDEALALVEEIYAEQVQ